MLAVSYQLYSAYLNKRFKLKDHVSWIKDYLQTDKNVLYVW